MKSMHLLYVVALILFGNLAHALTPPPIVVIPVYIGTLGCPAAPSIVTPVRQDEIVFLEIKPCGAGPLRGALEIRNSDPNAIRSTTFNYNFLLAAAQPQPGIVFRTPGQHTVTVRDVENNLMWSVTVFVNTATQAFAPSCAVIAVALPPPIALIGNPVTILVNNCADADTPALFVVSSDPSAILPSGARVYTPSLGIPQLLGDVRFQRPSLQTLTLRDAGGAVYGVISFDVQRGAAEAVAAPVPINSLALIFFCTFVIAAVAAVSLCRLRKP